MTTVYMLNKKIFVAAELRNFDSLTFCLTLNLHTPPSAHSAFCTIRLLHNRFQRLSFFVFAAESDDEMCRGRVPSLSTTSNGGKLKRGRTRSTLRNIFGKLTRSTSQEIGAQSARGNGIR